MECNKDEALRAKQVAESRMQRGEFVDALRFAKKAQNLYSEVENIAQIITVCEVHNAAQNKLSGSDMNWYGILQTEMLADESAIKKQYRKLALLLHPDKNKFAGAEAAFKLIGEANRVLSDKVMRSLFDMKFKVSVRTVAPKTSSHHPNGNVFAAKDVGNATKHQNKSTSNTPLWNAHQQAPQASFHHPNGNVFAARNVGNATKHQNKSTSNTPLWNAHQQAPQASFHHSNGNVFAHHINSSSNTPFWNVHQQPLGVFVTYCKQCNIRQQFFTNMVNATCQTCLKPLKPELFFGIPNNAPNHGPPKPAPERKGEKPHGGDTFVHTSFMKTCATGVDRQSKREKSRDGNVPASKTMEPHTSENIGSKRVRQSAPVSRGSSKAGIGDEKKDASVSVRENDADPSRLNVRRSSRQKQQVSYAENTEDDDFGIPSKKARHKGLFDTNEDDKENVPTSGGLSKDNNPTSYTGKFEDSHVQGEQSKEDNCSLSDSDIPSSPEIIHCHDADFYDFEKDKAECCFAVNQFWATYDSFDSMPRFYAVIKKVASPFELQITWLEPNADDQSGIDLLDAELPIACGKFKLGVSQKTTDRGIFSHQIQCVKGNDKGSYLVYPKKGETWAIFKDWDMKWSSNPENYLKCEFEYVEILSDFAENVGIEVVYLSKMKGFVSLFQKTEKNGVNISCVIPSELYRFSHRIPSYKMTGNEREGVSRGCIELDPAALPNNFFEVCTDGN